MDIKSKKFKLIFFTWVLVILLIYVDNLLCRAKVCF